MRLIAVLSTAFMLTAYAQQAEMPRGDGCLAVGEMCSGFAGPVGTCCPGSYCYQEPEMADYATCKLSTPTAKPTPKATCIPKGGSCATIAGPSKTPCCSGTVCRYIGPDRGVCVGSSSS